MHYGVDVSSNNPHPINWAALHAYLAGLGGGAQPFAVVKISQGQGYVNPYAHADIAAARAAGFAVAGYMMDQGNVAVSNEEALFLAHSEGLAELDDDELPSGLGTAGYIAHLRPLAATGHPQYLNQSEEDAGYAAGGGIWEANYNNRPGVTHRQGVLIHQYTSSGVCPGIPGNPPPKWDLNCWTGSEAAFAALFHIQSTPQEVLAMGTVLGIVPDIKAGKGYHVGFVDGSVWSMGGTPNFYGSYGTLPPELRKATADFVGFGGTGGGGYVLMHRDATSNGDGFYVFGPE